MTTVCRYLRQRDNYPNKLGDLREAREGGAGERWDYARRLAAKGTPGSALAADGRTHWRGIPCPPDDAHEAGPRYLSADRHLWLPLYRDLDLRKVQAVLNTAFPGKRRRPAEYK